MQLNHIEVTRTARYAQLGTLSADTETIWMVCHGYAQLAEEFIEPFKTLQDERTVVVAPEGLSRFYARGFGGRVTASWMTRGDRENEIKDYVAYLRKLYDQLQAAAPNARFYLLGFSQGTATISRFVTFEKPAFSKLFFCSGSLPDDLDFDTFRAMVNGKVVHYITGDNDSFFTQEQVQQYKQWVDSLGFDYEFHQFSGGHEINAELLKKLG